MQAILDATERLLEDEGVGDITTAKIAGRAGVSAGTVYLYFPNKNAVLDGLLERWLGFVNQAIADHDVANRPFSNWLEWIDSIIGSVLAIYERVPGLVAHYDAVTAIPELRARDAQQDERVVAWNIASLRLFLPDAKQDDLEIAAILLLTIVHSVLRQAVLQPEPKKQKSIKSLRAVVYTLITNVSN